ncbi:hypothetical protein FB645_003413 [Coemansia sp. IMI 203386]|nr:hypothetical protein FB645_003413 [Coemansia sp. IMI 203386]
MITLPSLIADYGKYVDRDLIAAIWAENSHDETKCLNIVHMLSGQPNPANHTPVTPTASEDISTNYSDVLSQSSTPSSKSSPRNARICLASQSSSCSSGSGSGSSTRLYSPSTGLGGIGNASGSIEAITSSKTLVEFLAACFPECGRDYLETKANDIFITQQTSNSLQVDPIEAIDIISNSLYNDMEEVETQMYQQKVKDQSSPSDGQRDTGGTSKDVSANSTSLAAIEAKYNVEPQPKTKRGKGSNKGKDKRRVNGVGGHICSSRLDSASGGDNAWSDINKELDQLCALFPMLSAGSVRSTYHKCGADVDAALLQLSVQAEKHQKAKPRSGADILGRKPKAKHPVSSAAAAARVLRSLQEIFPDQDIDLLNQAAQSTADISIAAEKVLTLISQAEAAEKEKDKHKKGTKWQRADQLSGLKVVSSSSVNGDQSAMGKRIHDVFTRIPLTDLAGDAREWVTGRDVDPAYCRKKAEEYIDKRNELYTKAAQAYSRRNSQRNHSGTALYYSTEGHRQDARARIWRMRAAQATVAAARRNDASVIDLHGLSRAEAVALALEEVNSWYVNLREEQRYRPTKTTQPLHIVTGLGNRSANGKPLVHPAVLRALREQGWWVEENSGYINVYGSR